MMKLPNEVFYEILYYLVKKDIGNFLLTSENNSNLSNNILLRLLKTNLPLGNKIEEVSKRYGLASYILIIFLIIMININANSEHSANYLSWMKFK